MVTNVEQRVLGGGYGSPEDYGGDFSRIQFATVREVDFMIDGNNKLKFYFSRGINVDLSTNPIRNVLINLCTTGNILPIPNAMGLDRLNPRTEPILALKHEYLGYVIYKISAKNWQFGRVGVPITVSDSAKEMDCFFQCRRVFYENSQLTGDKGGTPGHEKNGCKVAYLIVDGAKARDPTTDSYDAGINLNVELVSDETPPRYTPFVIDPDIRYPGGSAP